MEEPLGTRIRKARLKRGITQQKIAEYLGISREAVTMMESGQTTGSAILRLKAIALFLGVSMDYLVSLREDEGAGRCEGEPTALVAVEA